MPLVNFTVDVTDEELAAMRADKAMDFDMAMDLMDQFRDVARRNALGLPTVYLVVRPDRGDGAHRLDTAGICAYARSAVAREDISRYLFPTGYAVLDVPIVDKPQFLPKNEEQRRAWEEKEKK